MPRDHVILFRNPSTEPSRSNTDRDPYESAAASLGYAAHTLPVLAQEFVHEDDLVRTITLSEEWSGVVATSKRAGEAWVDALRHFRATGKPIPKWDHVPLYTPGAATTTAFSVKDLDPTSFPTIVDESQTTGCAELLGPFIVSDVQTRRLKEEQKSSKPLLVLTGDKNSPELTDILQRHGIAYEELEVYRTCPRTDIRHKMDNLIKDIVIDTDDTDQSITIWLAFFSPSSADAVLSASSPSTSAHQRPWYERLVQQTQTDHGKQITFRVAAIGKTTRLYLQQRGYDRVVQAERPNAEYLATAIAAARRDDVVDHAGAQPGGPV